jgi:hypothetical protein
LNVRWNSAAHRLALYRPADLDLLRHDSFDSARSNRVISWLRQIDMLRAAA